MARFDLNEANGWIPEETGSTVITAAEATSFIESQARKEQMASRTKSVPRFLGDDPVVVAEGAVIPEANPTADEVVLTAHKWAKILHISEEDMNDSLVDVLTEYKRSWASNWAKKFDNACLGVTAAGAGTDAAPYNSVYREVTQNAAGNRIATGAGAAVTFEQLNDALAVVETGTHYDPANTVFVVSPMLLGNLRNLKDTAGDRVTLDPVNGTVTGLFGYPVVVSQGARTSAAATSAPTGNPLVIVGPRNLLINGVRSGIESQVSLDPEFRTDGVLLKVRARRAFAVGRPDAFAVIEKMPAA